MCIRHIFFLFFIQCTFIIKKLQYRISIIFRKIYAIFKITFIISSFKYSAAKTKLLIPNSAKAMRIKKKKRKKTQAQEPNGRGG